VPPTHRARQEKTADYHLKNGNTKTQDTGNKERFATTLQRYVTRFIKLAFRLHQKVAPGSIESRKNSQAARWQGRPGRHAFLP
jgi:hypothetical protein